jgi:Bacterial Ig domain
MACRSDVRVEAWATDDGPGLLVYDPLTGGGHVLNTATAAVFGRCDGRSTRTQMADAIAEATGLPPDVDIVELAIAELAQAGLLEAPPVSDVAVSRRTVIGRLALGAGAVALLPVIASVVGVGQAAASPSRSPQIGFLAITVADKSMSTAGSVPVAVTLTSSGGLTGPEVLFWIETDPGHGAVAVSGTTATYTPVAGFTGTDTFTYLAGQCAVSIDVGAAPQGGRTAQVAGVPPTCSLGTSMVSAEAAATVTITVTAPATTTTRAPATTTTAKAEAATATPANPSFTG